MGQFKYKPHKSSIINISVRLLLILTVILSFFINLGSTNYIFAWIPPMIVFYLEKESIFVKYHSLLLVFIEIVRGLFLFFLTILSLQFNIPYFYGMLGQGDFSIGAIGYFDIALSVIILVFQIYQIWKISNYQELNIKSVDKVLYYFIKKDPRYYDLENKYR